MRLLRRSVSLVLALLLLLGMSATTMAAQNYESVSLTGTGGTGTATYPDAVSFSVNMGADVGDKLTIYKIANAVADGNGSVEVTWTPAPGNVGETPAEPAQAWVREATADGGILESYQRPADLASASTDVQTAVLTELTAYLSPAEGQEGAEASPVNAAKAASVDADPANKIVFESVSKIGSIYTFTNLPTGLYLAYSMDDGVYTPFTINMVPERQPDNSWSVVSTQVSKKFSGATLVKTISDDQVGKGDEVEFTITATVPSYPAGMLPGQKIFTIDDDMSTAFAYVKDSLVVEYIDPSGTPHAVSKTGAGGTAIYTPVISSEVTIYTCPTASHQYFNIYEVQEEGTYYYYFLKDDVMHLLYSTVAKDSSTLTYSGPVFKAYQKLTGDTISHGLSPKNESKNLFNINFDYEALAAWLAAENLTGGGSIRIAYRATVTDDIAIASQNNTNTAVLRYAVDENGTVGRLTDTVRAYTYGIRLKKVNGDTLDASGNPYTGTEYLAGAIFSLYELESYGTKGYYEVTINAIGTATGGADMTVFNDRVSALGEAATGTYLLPYTDPKSSEILGYHLYVELKNDLTSVANSDGVTVEDLGPGTYLLIETMAPTGYNLLSQGIRFTIAEQTGDGTVGKRDVSALVDIQEVSHSSGYYDLLVSNFKGLTLPETGGEGTMMFTAFGFVMMTAAMFVLVMKKRRMA